MMSDFRFSRLLISWHELVIPLKTFIDVLREAVFAKKKGHDFDSQLVSRVAKNCNHDALYNKILFVNMIKLFLNGTDFIIVVTCQNKLHPVLFL